MNKLISLLKATFTEDFNKTSFKKNKKKSTKNIFIFILKFFLVLFIVTSVLGSVAVYAALLGDPLSKLNLTYIMLSLFSIVGIMVIFMEGIYRAGAVLFESRDNDMLLSMPIKKSTIVASRLIRFIVFEYIWTLIIMVPTIAVYEYFEKTNIYFYISTIAFLFIMPIIPTILASIVGYFIKLISSRFKRKNIIQVILSFILFFGIFIASLSLQKYIEMIVKNAKNINDIILKIYYPLGIYVQTILDFSAIKVVLLVIINILIVVVFVYLFSLGYYKIISKLSENYSSSNYKLNKIKEGKTNGVVYALFKKEFVRYITSPIYLFNTAFGSLMIIAAGAYLIIKSPTTLIMEGKDLTFMLKYIPEGLMMFFAFTFGVSCTTASSISLEGKNFWIIKSLPVKEIKIFISKILINLLILLPAGYLVILGTSIKFKFSLFNIIMLVLSSTIMALFISITGLVINLTLPRLNFKSDAQIVKQSASVMITMLAGILPVAAIAVILSTAHISNLNLFVVLSTIAIGILTLLMWIILKTYGIKRFRELS